MQQDGLHPEDLLLTLIGSVCPVALSYKMDWISSHLTLQTIEMCQSLVQTLYQVIWSKGFFLWSCCCYTSNLGMLSAYMSFSMGAVRLPFWRGGEHGKKRQNAL